jgi:hypothetical protein
VKTAKQTIIDMENEGEHWRVPFFNFVDGFRISKDIALIAEPIELKTDELNKRYSALIAATVAYLCDEMDIVIPQWAHDVPALERPWFISGVENLRAITIACCPVQFKQRLVFVLDNFLIRV